MCWQEWNIVLGVVQKVLASMGIIAGAFWAYFHYFRGRTYKPRLETSIAGKIVKQKEILFLIVRIKIKNVGLSKIDIKKTGSGMRIIGIEQKENVSKIEKYEGTRLKTVSILENHSWIEPRETIDDVHTFILPNNAYFGLKLDVRLITNKIVWRFSSVEEINQENKLVE